MKYSNLIKKVYKALSTRDKGMLVMCLEHGCNPNKVLDEKTGDSIDFLFSYYTFYS